MISCVLNPTLIKINKAKKIGNYAITPSYKCNWFCKYCIVDTHNREDPDFEVIKKQINDILPKSFVAISGGEPGLVPKDKLNYIYSALLLKECFIQVNTNGTFFKNCKEFIDSTGYFIYHCSENLTNPIIVPDVPSEKIHYTLVLTNENYKRLDNYIDQYPFLIQLVGADRNKGKTLSIQNGIEIFDKYKHKLTIQSMMGLITRYSKYEEINHI